MSTPTPGKGNIYAHMGFLVFCFFGGGRGVDQAVELLCLLLVQRFVFFPIELVKLCAMG